MDTHTALHMTGALLGGFLTLLFIGYLLLSFLEGKSRKELETPRLLAGFFSLALGTVMLSAWIYLLKTGWHSFRAQAALLSSHVITELLSALSLMLAGIAMLRAWSRGPALFMIANGFLLFTTLFALTTYGNQGHPFLMNGIAILLTVVSLDLVGLVYGWEHFVLHLDQPEPESEDENKAA